MPVKIPNNLPATEILTQENIFVMTEERAVSQDIRPLKILILNLMPNKVVTETQLLRLLGNTPLQIEVKLLYTTSYKAKNTSQEHLNNFYTIFSEIKDCKFDGLIITGAAVSHLEFEEVEYWDELSQIMQWSTTNVFSTLHLCWGTQAGLYYHYGIKRHRLAQKMFGVFKHQVNQAKTKLMRGFDDVFYVPHSRYGVNLKEDILQHPELHILSESEESGIYLMATDNYRQVFITGHSEYDTNSLKEEYLRDIAAGIKIDIPKNYFPNDDINQTPLATWRSHANLLFANWLNYCVYQQTPFSLDEV